MTIREQERKTYPFIDWCKLICIFLIVMNHLSGEYEHIQYMKSFRIPLFFFAAGFLFRSSAIECHWKFFIDRFKRLMVPYFVFYFLYMAHRYIPKLMAAQYEEFPWGAFMKHVIGAFYGIGSPEWMVAMPLWFLPCLFIVEIIYDRMARHFELISQVLGMVLGMSVIGYAMYFYHLPRLPWNLDVALMALPFYSVGHITRGYLIERLTHSRFERFALAGLFFSINYMGSAMNPGMDMNGRLYGDFIWFFLNGATGIIAMVLLTSTLPEVGAVKFYGRNTMTILGFHGFATLFSISILSNALGFSLWGRIGEESLGALVSLTIFLMLIPVIWVIERWLPWLSGKKRKRQNLKSPFAYCTLEDKSILSRSQGELGQ